MLLGAHHVTSLFFFVAGARSYTTHIPTDENRLLCCLARTAYAVRMGYGTLQVGWFPRRRLNAAVDTRAGTANGTALNTLFLCKIECMCGVPPLLFCLEQNNNHRSRRFGCWRQTGFGCAYVHTYALARGGERGVLQFKADWPNDLFLRPPRVNRRGADSTT